MSGQGVANDEHGDRADRIAGPEPRSASHDDRHAEKDHREAVRETRHRGPGALRRLDEAHNASIGAFRGPAGGEEIEGLSDIRHPAHDLLATVALNGDRFAG